eukprot:gb/GECG01006902.1/.p1 GENE.gb/GECG01006902.1/~~gb/GECG01006902.1/.p1  ORF type:complete len:374 (+),score=24.07 gb/GECG01006902.1/:1-1122(+)
MYKLSKLISGFEVTGKVHFLTADFVHADDFANTVSQFVGEPNHDHFRYTSAVDVGSGHIVQKERVIEILAKFLRKPRIHPEDVIVQNTSKRSSTSLDVSSNFPEDCKTFIQWFEDFHSPSGVVFSTYLVLLKDPQRRRKKYSVNGSFKNIAKFYNSIHRLDIQAYIFHDGLSSTFRNKYETSRFIFIHVSELGGIDDDVALYTSNNDRRFFYYQRFMKRVELEWVSHPSYVLACDLFDVMFPRDPFIFLEQQDHSKLLIGSENRRVAKSTWMRQRFRRCRFSKSQRNAVIHPKGRVLLNAGIIGGSWNTFREFLLYAIAHFPKFNPKENCNMPVVNYVAYGNFSTRLVTGYPLHSRYKKFERKAKNVYIIHKR